MSSLVKSWLVQSRTSIQERELFAGGLELPRISCFQEMPEVWFQEALERMLGRTMCVLDGAVLLHAHPIRTQAIVDCIQARSQDRDGLPLLARGFKENAIGHFWFNSLDTNSVQSWRRPPIPTTNCQPYTGSVSHFDLVSVKWVIFGGLEVGISLLRDDIQKGFEVKEMFEFSYGWGIVKLGAVSQPFHLRIHSPPFCECTYPIFSLF